MSTQTPSFATGTINRRRFVKSTAATTAALAFAPFIRADDKSEVKRPVVGSGAHTYEVIHDWGGLPERYTYGNTHGVAEDSQGLIYIKHTVGKGSQSDDAIIVFDAEGKFVKSWGKEFKGGAHGLHLSKEGGDEFFYLCDTGRRLVVKTTLNGDIVWTRGCPFEESGDYKDPKEYVPTNVAVAPNGEVFVADGYGRNYIHVYATDGKYLRTFGGTGKSAGRTSCPHGLMVDTRGSEPTLVVADRSNRRLQYFSLEGRHLGFVTDELRAPCHFHTHGDVMLIPDLESRVTLFDKNNQLIAHLCDGTHYNGIRDKARDKFTAGKFVAPHSAIFDHAGNIFVVEWVEVGRVTKLRKMA
jgi:DNA-binding beta-propeller fold protein YncE